MGYGKNNYNMIDYIRNIAKLLLLFTVMGGVSSCDQENIVNEYSNGQCYLTYYGDRTPLQPLNAAIGGINTFCIIWEAPGPSQTSYYLNANLPGQEMEKVLVNSQSTLQRPIQLGKDNSKGIIIGRSSMQNGDIYVYDRVCPNCFTQHRNTKYIVQFDKNASNVTCSSCHRTYGLLNGGVVVNGDNGEKLLRYRAYCNGTTLNIQNP